MNPLFKNLLLALGLCAAASAGAENSPASAAAASSRQPATAAQMTDGEIKKIDQAAGKITLKHSEIKNLAMPPMTMAYAVGKSVALGQLKVGDKVKFNAERSGAGYIVSHIERAR
jgi:Cu(I)/Ag(I) efflux system periplasmic protein CusF